MQKLYVKKLNTGLLSFRRNRKRIVVKSGEIVECSPEELGQAIKDFVELKRDNRPKGQSILKSETARYEAIYRLDSWLLNPSWKAGKGQIVYTPNDAKGLSEVLWDREQAVEECKILLQKAWAPWKEKCKRDPMGELKLSQPDPSRYLEPIAIATAKLNTAKAEVAEVQARLSVLAEVEDDTIERTRKRLFMQGRRQRGGPDGRYTSCDGFEVVYEGSTPTIPEKGMSLRTYIDEVKAYKKAKAAEKSAKSIKARQEFLDNRKAKRLAGEPQ